MLEKIFDSGNIGNSDDIIFVNRCDKTYYADIKVPAFSGMVLKEKRTKNIKTLKEN